MSPNVRERAYEYGKSLDDLRRTMRRRTMHTQEREVMTPTLPIVGPRWIPPITCSCGEPHHLGARYYVSVLEHQGGRMILAAGPFLTHQEAIAYVDRVRRIALERYNPEGRAHWYAYGTVALPYDYDKPGKLNAEVFAPVSAPKPAPAKRGKGKKAVRKAVHYAH